MKTSTKFCAILMCVVSLQLFSSHAHNNMCFEAPEVDEYPERNHATSGMFFTSNNVVEEYEYDDAYILLYNDPDANMYNVEICVDLETYQAVQKAIQSGNELIGSLALNDDYCFDGVDVFTFMPEPEFEMAQASAKF